jgi:arylsulfatase A-like enzyme
MNRLAVVVLLLLASANLTAAEPPNVVLIVADDLGAMDLGCYGSKFHRTPHLDKLAADGMRFTQSYSACPVCSPSRAAIMTGQYPQRFQLTDWLPGRGDRPDQRLKRPMLRNHLPLEAATIAERLKQAGHVCASIGKWHLGGEGFGPKEHGFVVVHAGKANTPPTAEEGGKG